MHKLIHTLFVVLPMSGILSFVAVIKNVGWQNKWLQHFFTSCLFVLPVAYVAAFLVIPMANFITNKLIKK